MKLKTRDERGITLVGLIILIAIIAVIVVLMRWAFGLSEVINEKTKQHQMIDFMEEATNGSVKY